MEPKQRAAHNVRKAPSKAFRHLRQGQPTYAARILLVAAVNAAQLLVGTRWKRRACPCCGWEGAGFLWSANEHSMVRDAICPVCMSRSRHRALAVLVPVVLDAGEVRDALHFAPEPMLLPRLRTLLPSTDYRTTDLFRTDVDLPDQDIEGLDLSDRSFDLVLCNHVLEHVQHDDKAVHELARVTREGGVAILTVPGDWDGAATVRFPEADENGHWRHYGLDVADLFRDAFGSVEPLTDAAISTTPTRHGIRPGEPVYLCRP